VALSHIFFYVVSVVTYCMMLVEVDAMLERVGEVDRILIREYGRKSPQELEVLTGVPALEVAQRLERLLGERNFLSEDAAIRVLLFRLDSMVAEVESRLGDVSDRNVGAVVNAAAGAIGRQLRVLQDLRDRSVVDLERVQGVYARELVRIVELSFERLLGRLEERFDGVSADELRAEFESVILLVASEVDAERDVV
jgi:hypothetical protein